MRRLFYAQAVLCACCFVRRLFNIETQTTDEPRWHAVTCKLCASVCMACIRACTLEESRAESTERDARWCSHVVTCVYVLYTYAHTWHDAYAVHVAKANLTVSFRS